MFPLGLLQFLLEGPAAGPKGWQTLQPTSHCRHKCSKLFICFTSLFHSRTTKMHRKTVSRYYICHMWGDYVVFYSPLQQRRLDAVYFYMRSLMAKNPFLSAHDSLVGLFEETSRKVCVHFDLSKDLVDIGFVPYLYFTLVNLRALTVSPKRWQ